jgi:hypothetical protein
LVFLGTSGSKHCDRSHLGFPSLSNVRGRFIFAGSS